MLVVQGLKTTIEEPGSLRNEFMTSPDFWSIMRAFATRYDSAPVVFELLEQGCTGVPPSIMASNYEAAMDLLSEFSFAAGRAVLAEGKQEQKPRKSREVEFEPTKFVTRCILLCTPLTDSNRDSDTVSRGIKAVTTMYNMTGRIPELMDQSHLGSSEGKCSVVILNRKG